jgi:hypothetical protein
MKHVLLVLIVAGIAASFCTAVAAPITTQTNKAR